MPSGLPNSLINLIYPEEFKKTEDLKKPLIFSDPNDNWKHVKDFKRDATFLKIEKKIKVECIYNCLRVYSKLLFFYIEENREKICFPDTNIH
jgi:hypothetical protein